MTKYYFLVLVVTSATIHAQELTVEKIMRDPKWIGTSPSQVFWSYDNKTVFFNWNPEKSVSDSMYRFELNSKEPVKMKYNDAQLALAISNGTYNHARTKITFAFRGDIYLLDVVSGKIIRITQTAEDESNPSFFSHDEAIAYQQGNDLFAWTIASGFTKQLTDFEKEKKSEKKLNEQEQWLKREQLQTSDIIRQRKEKKDKQDDYLKKVKDNDTIHIIYMGDKAVQSLKISPDGRFITYDLFTGADGPKSTIVPAYVTETGFTTDIPGRTKVGAQLGKYEFYVFDRLKDTILKVNIDSIPGIKDRPDYIKDYPTKYKDTPMIREVVAYECFWNDTGTVAVLDIRSNDNKDRWLMQLDAASGKLRLLDRQRDEAWIAGPGIGNYISAGWINDHTFYFQSEELGYSHLYSFDINTNIKKGITEGKYEVQYAKLSNDKKYFYITTNEDNPGKQNWYRINVDGSDKQKITSMDGGFEVSLSPDKKNIAYRYSYQNKPWELYVQENAPAKDAVQVTDKAMSDEFKSYAWRDTKIFTFTVRDGAKVYARIYEPVKEKKNNAAVIFVHGAGYLQNVAYSWSYYFREMMFNNLLADRGYTVMDIDYRGSAGYGRNWRTGIYRYMGGKDHDEVDAAKFLVTRYGIDSTRIGMYGGSYGGFMTLMALFTQPDVFKAGAALRPVTDWAHYNHGYTSNILNEPFTDSIAYQRSSPINFASGLKNHLLICHGMVDVNVQYQDAVRLAQRLIELGKDNWELASYPVEDHGFAEPSSWTDEYKRILKLFDGNLVK